ncbi:MAG: BrnA antitoxin family protein [Chloroflexi bacterium]|nr:BrnA antitoxin family protein [Chloroflexota bacterium]MYE40397.1 BrnA antitoxin family protein [Chloroflexota bacterium]
MNRNRPRIVRNTPEEEAEIARQIAENPDEAEWTDEDWANAKSASELFPDYVKWSKERKAAIEAGLIECVTITLDSETVNWFKSQTGEDGETGGTKWMMLLEKTLREHARREAPSIRSS